MRHQYLQQKLFPLLALLSHGLSAHGLQVPEHSFLASLVVIHNHTIYQNTYQISNFATHNSVTPAHPLLKPQHQFLQDLEL